MYWTGEERDKQEDEEEAEEVGKEQPNKKKGQFHREEGELNEAQRQKIPSSPSSYFLTYSPTLTGTTPLCVSLYLKSDSLPLPLPRR